MKKKKKLLIFTVVILTIQFINKLLFLTSKIKYKKIKKTYHWYSWKFGKIHYRVQGSGPPLLLIHGIGNGASSYEWRKNIPYLSKFFKVYAIDLIGYGLSSKPKFTYTAFLYVQLIHDFIKDIIKEPPSIIANSQSSSFVIMACSYSPALFKKMILISPTGINKNNSYPTLKSKLVKSLIEIPLIGTTLYLIISSKIYTFYFFKKYLYKNINSISPTLVNTYHGISHENGSSSRYPLASFIGGYMNTDVKKALIKIKSDIFIIWGKENNLVPLSLLDGWLQIKPSISTYIFEKSKTMPHEEEPLYFNNICKKFLLN